MRKMMITAAVLASAMAVPAQAAVSIQFQAGANTVGPNQLLVNQFTGTGPARVALAGGSNAYTYFVDTGGEAVLPATAGIGNNGTTNGFGAVLGGGSYTFNLANTIVPAAQVFSFLIGTLDSYNSVTLNFANGTSQTLNGFAIAGLTSGNAAGGRVTYDANGGSAITSVSFASSSNSFEFDDFAAAAPEPATWAMMILGFGLAGAAMRRRRRQASGALSIA